MKQAAQRYASAGWRVFPVGPDKAPLVARGFHAATTHPGLIAEWWDRWPEANIGLDIPEGTVVLDFDPRNGAPEPRALGLPDTQRAATPSGGQHLYYAVPEGLSLVGQYPGHSGIDVKAAGRGYVLLPPSRTEAGVYAWVKTGTRWLPDWVLERLKRRERRLDTGDVFVPRARYFPWEVGSRYGLGVLRNQLELVRNAEEGTRNRTLFKATAQVASYIAGGELSEEVLDELRDAALASGLEMHEVMETMRSAYERGIEEPRTSDG